MRIENVEYKIYTFDELSEKAKERARNWWREASQYQYNDFHEFVYEDAMTIGKLMGLDISKIYYTGFWSQGDGACFEGRWEYKPDALEKVKEYAPLDEGLHEVAAAFASEKVKGCWAESQHRGHYYHEYSLSIDGGVRAGDDVELDEYGFPEEQYNHIKEMFADFARWIYKMLEAEYEYQTSNEQVDENIRCNQYEFHADGRLYR